MILNDILKQYQWIQLQNTFKQLFPTRSCQFTPYQNAFQQILQIQPLNTKLALIYRPQRDGKSLMAGKNEDHTGPAFQYWLNYYTLPWNVWLGLELTDSTNTLTPEKLICLCLKEMTRTGFNQDTIQEDYDEWDFVHKLPQKEYNPFEGLKAPWYRRYKITRFLNKYISFYQLTYRFQQFKNRNKTGVWDLDAYMKPKIAKALEEYKLYYSVARVDQEMLKQVQHDKEEAFCKGWMYCYPTDTLHYRASRRILNQVQHDGEEDTDKDRDSNVYKALHDQENLQKAFNDMLIAFKYSTHSNTSGYYYDRTNGFKTFAQLVQYL
jgi:hypothetical protein